MGSTARVHGDKSNFSKKLQKVLKSWKKIKAIKNFGLKYAKTSQHAEQNDLLYVWNGY